MGLRGDRKMREFEKWLDNKSYSQAEERIAESSWKAALAWALTQRTSGIEEDGTISYCNYVSLDRLKEELNAKT